MLYFVTVAGRTFRVELDGDHARIDGADVRDVSLVPLPGTSVRHLLAGGRSSTLVAQRTGDAWSLAVDGWPVTAEAVDERTEAIRTMTGRGAAAQGPRPVRAPMPGLIVRVEVATGDEVRPGQGVVAMEAMKMENELKAETGGIVSRILVAPGQAVEKGTVLVEFEAEPA